MVKQIINVEGYWRVIVYYNVSYNSFYFILKDSIKYFSKYSSPVKEVRNALLQIVKNTAKGVTISSIKDKVSIVIIGIHNNCIDFISTVVHEAEHIKQSMLYKYKVDDKDEPPAYTIGYLVSQMYKCYSRYIC